MHITYSDTHTRRLNTSEQANIRLFPNCARIYGYSENNGGAVDVLISGNSDELTRLAHALLYLASEQKVQAGAK